MLLAVAVHPAVFGGENVSGNTAAGGERKSCVAINVKRWFGRGMERNLCGSKQQSLLCIADLICAPQTFSIEYLKINFFAISYALLRLWTWLSNYHEYKLFIIHLQLREVSLTYLSLYRALVLFSAETFDRIHDLNFAFLSFFPVFLFPPESAA